MVAVATDDAWQEECLIAISAEGGSDVQFAALTETIDFDRGANSYTEAIQEAIFQIEYIVLSDGTEIEVLNITGELI